MFRLPDSWVWDFWLADDGQTYHLFFLYASRALKDSEARHYRASIGHATSADLRTWVRVEDALVRSDPPAFDDLATWTGSVVRHPDGTWFMFYTGTTLTSIGSTVQTIGYATSTDLLEWHKAPDGPVLRAHPDWYQPADHTAGRWRDEAFRDPWVLADPGGDGWHMLITARANHGPPDDRGVIGHAWSPDLRQWELLPPLTAPGQGYGHLEVVQVAVVDGQPILIFSCDLHHAAARRRAGESTGGVWVCRAQAELGPYAIGDAQLLTDERRYSGRLIRDRQTEQWMFLAFRNTGGDRTLIGDITDPEPVRWDGQSLVFVDEVSTGSQA